MVSFTICTLVLVSVGFDWTVFGIVTLATVATYLTLSWAIVAYMTEFLATITLNYPQSVTNVTSGEAYINSVIEFLNFIINILIYFDCCVTMICSSPIVFDK